MDIAVKSPPIPLSRDKLGVLRVSNTRVTLDTIVNAFNHGLTVEEIIMQYPSINLPDAYLVISFYLKNKKKIDLYLKEQEKGALSIRTEIEGTFSSKDLRDKLMARQTKKLS